MNNFNDEKWQDFIKACEDQVKRDNRELNINSVFLLNSEICHNPKYCLIAMEPLDKDLNELKRKIGQGYKNFIEGYEELILHYCAYHYLGKKECFNYYITDLSKGSMTSADANNSRKERWPRWQNLLKEEMNLLGNPKLIAIGKSVYEFINNAYIQHYSNNSTAARKREYDYINGKFSDLLDSYCDEIDKEKFKEFVIEKFIKHLNYQRKNEVEQILDKGKGLTEARRKLFALYRHNFESMTEKGKVLHLAKFNEEV
jgi:hypothetical protein